MADSVYHVTRLEESGGIQVSAAMEHFPDYRDYFAGLDGFIGEAKNYLRGYTASVVIYNQEMQESFLSEAGRIKQKLEMLGMSVLADEVSKLEYAAGAGSAETLADWIVRLHANIDSMIKLIESSRIKDDPAAREKEKPLILAVDDKPELLRTIADILGEDYKIIAVTSGAAALQVIERYTPGLFLLDIEMPQMNGYDLAKVIRTQDRFNYSPIIFLTGRNTRNDVIMAIKNGGNDYLLKPVERGLLLGKIERHLRMRGK